MLMTLRKTIFISDIHLDEKDTLLTERFLAWLQTLEASTIDALYILGDLFEHWIGDDDPSPDFRKIQRALLVLTQQKQIPVYFLHGNRDFLIGKQFCQATGVQLLPDVARITLYGTPVLILHGDLLCTQDHAYLRARKILHCRWLQRLFLWLPFKTRLSFASYARKKSTQHTQKVSLASMDAVQTTIQEVMIKKHVTRLIHGHIHRLQTQIFPLNDQRAIRIVLDSWQHAPNMLYWQSDGQFEQIVL